VRFATIDELTAAEKINSSYVSRLLRLTLLSPVIVEAILDGRQPEGMTLPGLMEPFPVEWDRQLSDTLCRTCSDRPGKKVMPGADIEVLLVYTRARGATISGRISKARDYVS